MITFLLDENVASRIGSALRSRGVLVHRVVELGLLGAADSTLLQFAGDRGWIMVSHDKRTMTHFASMRVAAAQSMTGLVVVPTWLDDSRIISDLLTIAGASDATEWVERIEYLPI